MVVDVASQTKLLETYKKTVWIEDLLRDGDLDITLTLEPFILNVKAKHKTVEGRTFYRLELSDKTGKIAARIWPEVLTKINADELSEGDLVVVSGELTEYNSRKYIKVTDIRRVDESQVDISQLLSNVLADDIDTLYNRLKEIIEGVDTPYIKELLKRIFIEDPHVRNAFKSSAAAESVHHDYVGGLLEHTLEMYDIAQALLKHYPQADKDLVTAGVLLHDIGKIIEYETRRTKVKRTKQGYLLGHIFLGIELISRYIPDDMPEEYKVQLFHIILAHHGQIEFGSPVVPATIEAIIVSVADEASSKVKQYHKELITKKPDALGFGDYQKYIRTRVYFSHLAREKLNGDSASETKTTRG